MWGFHLVLDIDGCNDNVTTAKGILAFLDELVPAIGMKTYGPPILKHFAEHEPDAAGYSLVQLIETSNICGHFSDLNRDAYLDIFSCAPFDKDIAMELTKKHFNPTTIQYLFLDRDAKAHPDPPFKLYDPKPMEGKCDACGICCCSDAYIIEEDGLSSWLDLHGYDHPMKCEQMAHVMVKKLGQDTAKIIFLDRCKNLQVMDDGIPRCSDYENRPEKCRTFPMTKAACFNIAECSFNKEE
jgi:Fe-S-cluster containining protein/S-adenosylmethionine/arginine decarboxylase-like enzyme